VADPVCSRAVLGHFKTSRLRDYSNPSKFHTNAKPK